MTSPARPNRHLWHPTRDGRFCPRRTTAPRDEPAVLVAALDIDQRRDWLAAFPFARARRPDVYG